MEWNQPEDFMDREYNCHSNKTKGCGYNNMCSRTCMIVYENTCQETGMQYIGQTQEHFKNRMGQHFQDVRKFYKGIKSDSYARHFAPILKDAYYWSKNPENKNPIKFNTIQRYSIKSRVLWQGKSISSAKTFGTTHCTLCDHERLAILERLRENPDKLINSCDELFGSCRHKTKFHRYVSTDSSTDDSTKEEKVGPMKVTTEV